MKKSIFILALINLSFSQSLDEIYTQAQNLEENGKYKEAMLLYKKAFKLKQKKILTEDETKAYIKIKDSFFKENIQKTDDKETNKSIKEIISNTFGIYSYKPNYLLLGTYDKVSHNDKRSQFETVFQISAKKPIAYDILNLDEIVNVAYTQKSFWQTSRYSSPFRETNYAPEIFVEFPYKSKYLKGYKVSLIHESNGRNGDFSRSWNRVYLEGFFQFSNLFVIPKVWYRIPEKKEEDDNPNIYKYYGYGELRLMLPYKNQNFDLSLRNNLKLDSSNKGSAKLNWSFPIPTNRHFPKAYGFLQVFTGYGNSLIDYDKKTHKIGFGIAISR